MSAIKELSETFSKPFIQRMEAYFKEHQTVVLVCVAIIALLFVLLKHSTTAPLRKRHNL